MQAAGLLLGLTASLGLSACGGTDSSPSLNNQSAQAVGVTLAAEVGSVPTSFTATSLSAGSVGGG